MDDALVMFLVGYIMIMAVIGLIAYFLTSFGYMKVFQKAGEAGWKGWVPFLCDFTAYKLSWETRFFWIFLAMTVVQGVLQTAFSGNTNLFLSLLNLALVVGLAAVRFMQCIRLAKAFGKGMGFSIGLFFLPPVFLLILGLGNAPYLGIQEI